MAKTNGIQLSQLVDMKTPAAVFEEVKNIFINHYPVTVFGDIRHAFKDFQDLFSGQYPGYRSCNTKFHDEIHTMDALLAIMRLIDGYNLRNSSKIPLKEVRIALIATIFHDTGYIQQKSDKKGTGAKYTLNHVERSVDFVGKYFKKIGYSKNEFVAAGNIINCTGLSADIMNIKFSSSTEKLLGYMLGSADLLGQMASRTYLERLIYLYREFKEGNVKGYVSEYELLKKTLGFYAQTKLRLSDTLKGVNKYLIYHFKKRYRVNNDLYQEAINRQIKYLEEMLKHNQEAFKVMLKRKV